MTLLRGNQTAPASGRAYFMISPNDTHSPVTLDLDLIRKYSVAGPRYTSYPPATQFTDQIP